MDEIATTLRTVANGIHQHFHDIVSDYQKAEDETRTIYQKMVDSESNDDYETFETAATLNAHAMKTLYDQIGERADIYLSDTSTLPAVIKDAATEVHHSMEKYEADVTIVADSNYKDLDALIPKFTVTGDIVDSLIGDAADDLK